MVNELKSILETDPGKPMMATDRRRDDQLKAALKEALKEWLDQKFSEFGKWSAIGIACMALVVATWLALKFAGWQPPVH